MRLRGTTAARSAVTAAIVVVTGAGLSAPMASAETSVPLPGQSYGDLLVDSAHHHLFVSGGPSSEVLTVTDGFGTRVKSIAGQPGADGMALSADGSTVYVAQSDADAISAVSTRTLQQTALYPTGSGTRPQDVVVAGGRLWFSYKGDVLGGQALTGGIGSVDLGGGGESAPVTLEEPTAWGAPRIAADPADPGRVVTASADGTNHTSLAVYDVSSGAAVRTAYGPQVIDNGVRDLAVTPDGRDMAVAGATPKAVQLFALADLAPDGSYPTGDDFAMAVAVAPDGTVAAGSDGAPATGLRIFSAGAGTGTGSGTQPPRAAYPAPVVSGGLAWAPDESMLYAVSGGVSPTLRIYFNPEQAPTTMAVTAAPGGVAAVPYPMSGTLTGVDPFPAGTEVHAVRTDAADPEGVALPDAPVGADGSFSVTDAAPPAGDVSYRITFDGDKLHAAAASTATATFAVAAVTATLQAPAAAERGTPLGLSGALSSQVPFAAGQSVQVSRTDADGVTGLPDVAVAADGSFTVADTPPDAGAVTYTVSYAGDASHAPAGAAASFEVARTATDLTVTTDAALYPYRAAATVTVHLGATYDDRTVTLHATPYGGAPTLVASGTVDADGNLTATYRVTRRTTFTASFDGDAGYAPATATRTVRTAPHLAAGPVHLAAYGPWITLPSRS